MPLNRRGFVQRMALALGAVSSKPLLAEEAAATPAPEAQASHAVASTPHHEHTSRKLKGYIRPNTINIIEEHFDIVVVGGGISGLCAAISAARNGLKTALVHERSALGGNSSSEVRLYPEETCSFSPWIKEAGILEEISVEERVRNWEPATEGLMNSQWDLVLYEWARREKNLHLFLNTTMREVEMKDPSHILAIHAAQLGTEKGFVLEAPLFVDASGDGVLGYRAGADFRWGREAQSEYGEALAQPKADEVLMGNTLFFRARDTGKPIDFKCPDWAATFETEKDLTHRGHGFIEGGYWWIEVGQPYDPIRDNEKIRDEALRQLLGVWDHIKNRCSDKDIRERAKNYALEFVGFWPYKRESRRILGDYVLTEKDVRTPSVHADDIAYGSWGIDIHVPGGILKRDTEPYPSPKTDINFKHRGTIPYGIPLRSCYSRNVHNLLTAGRPISASYVAFASTRVLPTGAIVGQGIGVAAALCRKYNCDPRTVAKEHAAELQQILLRQDASMPAAVNADANDLARSAKATSNNDAPLSFPEEGIAHRATLPLGQLIPISTDKLDKVELLMHSNDTAPQPVKLSVWKASSVFDLRPTKILATATGTVKPGDKQFVSFPLNMQTEPGGLYFIQIDKNPHVSWTIYVDKVGEPSRIPVGASPADFIGGPMWRPFTHGKAFAMRVHPEQRPYTAQNLITGTNRPDRWTNIYLSDPQQSLPAHMELAWERPVQFNQIQVTFDTNMVRRTTLPNFRNPDCVKHYTVEALVNGSWKTLVEEKENYQRRRVHAVEPVTAGKLRLVVHATNGSPQARIYEIRVYNEQVS
ncbi:MAG: FAD-dependent oxidoreductase [Acidobacteria bacterium]|nr:FAD-dependent oxidoreductase [Acidobacteriota bacterium]